MNMHAPTGVIPPAPPKSLKDTGLNIVMMRDILLKTIFRKNLEHVSEMSEFQLSDAGKARALDALSQSEYYGALPVPLEMYKEQVQNQSVKNVQITRDRLLANMGHLILPEELLEHLGPAVSSGRSVLLYGPPGNGKSAISNGIRDALGDVIYIPHCIEYAGQVITLFDPIVHTPLDHRYDGW